MVLLVRGSVRRRELALLLLEADTGLRHLLDEWRTPETGPESRPDPGDRRQVAGSRVLSAAACV